MPRPHSARRARAIPRRAPTAADPTANAAIAPPCPTARSQEGYDQRVLDDLALRVAPADPWQIV